MGQAQRDRGEGMSDIPSFDAFLSYASAADRALVRKVERLLEGFHRHLPFRRQRLRPLSVCVDGSDLQIRSDDKLSTVQETLIAHLKASRYLVVFCSSSAKESRFVDFEIRWWLANKTAQSIVPVVTEGSNEASIHAQVFPPALIEAGLGDAVWLDLRNARKPRLGRFGRSPEGRNPAEEQFRLAALLHDYTAIPPAWQRARRLQFALALGALLLVFIGSSAWYAWTKTDAYAVHQLLLASLDESDIQLGRGLGARAEVLVASNRSAAAFELLDRLNEQALSDAACRISADAPHLDEGGPELVDHLRKRFVSRGLEQPPCLTASSSEDEGKRGSTGDLCSDLGKELWAMSPRDVTHLLSRAPGKCHDVSLPSEYDMLNGGADADARLLKNAMLAMDSQVLDDSAKAHLYSGLVSHLASDYDQLPIVRRLASRYHYPFRVTRPRTSDFGAAANPLLLGMEPDAPPEPDPPPQPSDIGLGWPYKNTVCVYAMYGLGRSFSGDASAARRAVGEATALVAANADNYQVRTYGTRCIAASLGAQGNYAEGIAFARKYGTEEGSAENTIVMFAEMQAGEGKYALALDTSRLLRDRARQFQTQTSILEMWRWR
ncbi:MAG: toll/interleukin-1 receptor domain-containing protein [Gemmatimonadaceae bacterium]